MSTLNLADGIRMKDGIDFNDGIDIEGRGSLKAFPKALKRSREAVAPPPAGAHRPSRRTGGSRGPARAHEQRARWTTSAIYDVYSPDARQRPAHKAQAIAPNRHVQRYLALAGHGYGRRCSVKIRYTEGSSRPGAGRKLASFAGRQSISSQVDYNRGMIGYIGRRDATLAGEPADRPPEEKTLFTLESGETLNLSLKEAGLIIGGGDVFTVVISPEDKGFDPAVVAGNFIEEFRRHCCIIDKKTGKEIYGAPDSLRWVGAVHKNTDHTHIHLMIGRDTPKGKLRVGKTYTKDGARRDCERILTDLMGERSWDQELEMAKEKALRTRFTSIDAMILKMAAGKNEIGKWSIENRDDHNAILIEERLKQLRRWRLASYSKKAARWSLSPEYRPSLERFEMLSALGMDPESEGFTVDRDGASYRGTILKAVREDEGKRVFMLIQGQDGLRHLRIEELEEGDEVIPPEGVVNVTDIRGLMRYAAEAGRRERT